MCSQKQFVVMNTGNNLNVYQKEEGQTGGELWVWCHSLRPHESEWARAAHISKDESQKCTTEHKKHIAERSYICVINIYYLH